MFGSSTSPSKTDESAVDPGSPVDSKTGASPPDGSNSGSNGTEKRFTVSPVGRRSTEDQTPNQEKKRRSSGISKAKDMLSSAKQSMLSPTSSNSSDKSVQQTPMQKLGKTDPALSVPQGPLNNSAGESVPGPRSTFRVGVTEDKNKKCRRTMEDTHAYLYNFLSTPAPAVSSPTSSKRAPGTETNELTQVVSGPIQETDNGYFAIFDGHAGTFAADWCGKKLHRILEDTIRKNPNTPIPELLDQTFTSVDNQLEKLPLKNSGCTAVIAVLRWEDRIPNAQSATGSTAFAPAVANAMKASANRNTEGTMDDGVTLQTHSSPTNAASSPTDTRKPCVTQPSESQLRDSASRQRVLYTANVGDARIVLCRNGKALRLSYDHKGSDENEGKRISNAGGLILNNRVNGVLAVTRALGDAYMKDLVTGHPYTTETVVQPDIDEFLILACDGLWDVCSDQEAVDLIRHCNDPQEASRILVDHALSRFSTDNLSCMIVRFNNRLVQDTVERKVDLIGVEGDPLTLKGYISETEAIVTRQKKQLDESGEGLERVSTEMIAEEEDEDAEPGPELNVEALKSAKQKAEVGKKES